MVDFFLRPATESDAPKIRDLIHRVHINPMDLNWKHFFVAELRETGRFIGCGQLKPHRDGSLELASLAVEEEVRGQGVARALIEHLLAHSSRPLFLMCRPELIPFYEIFGFRTIEPEVMPPYFRRIHRLTKTLAFLVGAGPAVMRLE